MNKFLGHKYVSLTIFRLTQNIHFTSKTNKDIGRFKRALFASSISRKLGDNSLSKSSLISLYYKN